MLNLATVLESSARDRPDATAITFPGSTFTYAEVDGLANQVAIGIRAAGIEPGQRIALCSPNVPQFIFVYFGIIKAGCVVVPFNVLLAEDEFAYILEDSGAVGFFCFEGTNELPVGETGRRAFDRADGCRYFWSISLDPQAPDPFPGASTFHSLVQGADDHFDTVDRSGEDTAVILYTSGTTGRPKGAELTHSNLVLNTVVLAKVTDLSDQDRILVALPLFHVFGQVVLMLAGFLGNCRLVLMPRFEPAAVFERVKAERVTVLAGVPTMYWGLLTFAEAEPGLDAGGALETVRVCATGGAAMPLEVLRAVEERFNVTVLEGYGLSETSPGVSFNSVDVERRAGSVGRAIWGVEMRIVDPSDNPLPPRETGEVVVRGHCVMKGYLNRPEATAEAMRGGWFHTGDLGYMDEEGYLYIVDRLKDLVIRGGYNVYPREVEEVLIEHPEVSLCAVIGVPHEQYGEELKAFIVREPGSHLDAETVIAFARERVAAYKYPRIVEFCDSLPMNATGKILKTHLRKQP